MKLPSTFSSWVTYYDHISPSFPQAHEMVLCTLPEEQQDGTVIEKSFPLQAVKAAAFDELQKNRITREDFLTIRKILEAATANGTTEVSDAEVQQTLRNLVRLIKH